MAESRLQRWSRRKAEADRDADSAPAHNPTTPEDAALSPEEQELAENETLSEQEVLDKYGLPDPDNIELGTDVTGFMRKEIPDLLRRKALRSLWRSNPVLAVLDGLNDYDEDFTDAGATVKGATTLYKVGQGMIDKTRKIDEKLESRVEAPAKSPEPTEPEGVIEKQEPEVYVEPLPDRRSIEPVASESEAEAEPHYRPRMRFE